jgi:hypothetical protein
VRGDAERLRELQRELGELANKASAIAREERTRWELERSLELAQKAQQAGCQREFLEMLLRSHTAGDSERLVRYSTFTVTEQTITALAWLVLEKNLTGHEKRRFVPSVRPSYPGVPEGSPGGVPWVLNQWSYRPGDFLGTAMAAIDSYEDERAREFLLDVALKTPRAGKFLAPIHWALGFLASYDPRAIEPKLKAAYEARGSHGGMWEERYESRLCAILDEFRYVKSLDPAAQQRYQHISRLLLRASAVAPQHGHAPDPQMYAEDSWTRDWQEGDERFLPHMREIGQVAVPTMLVRGPISPKGVAWLKEQAASGNWPARVKKDLGRLLREREKSQERMRQRAPRGIPPRAKDTKPK